jgi:ATP synthase protein I
MTATPPPEDPFVAEVRRQAERARRGAHLTFWQGLGLVGAVGWMVSVPAVLGALAGRWLDAHHGGGLFWTLGLLTAGLGAGCLAAWRHGQRELQA